LANSPLSLLSPVQTRVNTSAWFDVSPSGGTLLPGGAAVSSSPLLPLPGQRLGLALGAARQPVRRGLAPSILTPPQSQTVECSSNATFSVTACGPPPLLYQWQFFSTNLPNATNVNLVLSNVKTNDAGDYMVVITNPSGSVTSVVATLTVLRPPVITRQPKSLAAAPGGAASFSVSAQGSFPFAYQWQRNGTPLAGQTKPTVTITNIQSEDFAAYTIGITNADGSALSDVAMLTLAVSPLITSLSLNSETFMLTVPTEVGPTYVVEYKDSLEDSWWNVLTTITGTGSPVPITDNGLTNTTRFYRVRVR